MGGPSRAEPILVEVERSGFVESVHFVDVAIVDEQNRLVAAAGDPDRVAAFRSSAKPIQARVAIEAGWQPKDPVQLAVACASHNGEDGHVDAVRSILSDANLTEDALLCPPDLPFWRPSVIAASGERAITHNCSGKHAAMLAACVVNDWSTAGYRLAEHPLQRRITDLFARLNVAGPSLVDGCGVPTPTAPLRLLAAAFRAIDRGDEAAAMRAHPWHVGGTDRLDTDLMTAAPDLLVKAGAEGLACVSGAGFGIALKARDGGTRHRGPALMLVLDQLGLVSHDALPQHREPPVLGGGQRVGRVRARGTIVRA